ncbi:MAG: methyl-accepting chemotaxis protein, partial [Candidatus Methanoperedens sp.]|nr:methyl-accepting chemotaxis protein [Candidatus Methanoperedens sp.]
MNLIKIFDKANELTIDRFSIGMKIAYSFFVVDSLILIVGYIGLYRENVSAFINPAYAIILGVLFAIVSSILMCMGLTRSIMYPLKQFENSAKKIAKGDLTTRVSLSSKDELGQLSRVIQAMTDSLKDVIGNVQLSALKVASTARELSASSEELKASTDQISNTTQDIASG